MKKIVLITGGFDPLHSGHISYIQEAKKLGDLLIIGVNSDQWLARKKGKCFMPLIERANILRNIKGVNFVIDFNDDDNTAKHAIWMVRQSYPQDKIVFANGGDRTHTNIPEMDVDDNNLTFAFGIGGFDKMNSSRWILEEWKAPKTERPWGYYRVLHENNAEVKVKELTVDPGQSLSMQKHQDRSEHWFIVEGTAEVYSINRKSDHEFVGIFHKHQSLHIKKDEWHQLCNPSSTPLKIVEIQYGTNCIEEDIERK